MKKRAFILVLTACLSFQYAVFAAAPCTTNFALNYAIASTEKAVRDKDCEESILTGPCKEESGRIFRNIVHNIIQDFSNCCCTNGYTECCN